MSSSMKLGQLSSSFRFVTMSSSMKLGQLSSSLMAISVSLHIHKQVVCLNVKHLFKYAGPNVDKLRWSENQQVVIYKLKRMTQDMLGNELCAGAYMESNALEAGLNNHGQT